MRICGVSQLSVSGALSTLEADGLIVRRPRSGIYVAESRRNRPRLILCEPSFFINPSPFSEMVYESIASHYVGAEDGVVIRFTVPPDGKSERMEPHEFLAPDLWDKLRARQFSSILLFGTNPNLTPLLDNFDLPIVALGTPAPYVLRFGMVDACQVGVAELARLGCRKLSLYNSPYHLMREVFMSALAAHGLESVDVGHEDLFDENTPGRPVQSNRLVERGRNAAHRAIAAGHLAQRNYGILSTDDMLTQGFIHGLIDHGLKVGEDVEIATYANRGSPVLGPWESKLTHLELDVRQMTTAMRECADSLCEGRALDRSWFAAGRESFGPVWCNLLRLALRRKGEVGRVSQIAQIGQK